MARRRESHTFLSGAVATGAGTALNVAKYKHIVVFIATDGGGTADLTCKCQGSIANAAPSWDVAQSVTNQWDYVFMYDLNDPVTSNIKGDTGFVVSSADDYRILMVNVDGLQWINFNVTAYVAGEVTVTGKVFTNQ